MITKLRALLSGKKTYLTAIAAILTAAGAYGAGEMEFASFIEAVFVAAGAIFMRSGIEKAAK